MAQWMLEPELELLRAAKELEAEFPMLSATPESETGLGAATALVALVRHLSDAGGFVTPEQQRDALRVGLAQWDAGGEPVRTGGQRLNRPDVAYVHQGAGGLQRVNIEIDTDPARRLYHQRRLNARDPNAQNVFVEVHPWTGQIQSVRVRTPGSKTKLTSGPTSWAALMQLLPKPSVPPPRKKPQRTAQPATPGAANGSQRSAAKRPAAARRSVARSRRARELAF